MKDKYKSWEDAMSLPEVKCLIQLQHPNLVILKEVIRSNQTKELFLIFELLSTDLHDLIKHRKKTGQSFSESEIQIIIYNILKGLSYIHKRGFFHRDLKPDNILIASSGKGQIDLESSKVKISDFGLCREINTNPPYTEYISTRWYRAPECVLRSRSYSFKMDIFAVGCIMAELFNLSPLLPGQSATDQFRVLCKVLGTPSEEDWADITRLFSRISAAFTEMPQYRKRKLSEYIPTASDAAIRLMEKMLQFDSKKRPTADQLLKSSYFEEVHQTNKFKEQSSNKKRESKHKTKKSDYESMKITEQGIKFENESQSNQGFEERKQNKASSHVFGDPRIVVQAFQNKRSEDNSQSPGGTLKPKLFPINLRDQDDKEYISLRQNRPHYASSKILEKYQEENMR